jgi:hypothetical protein
VKTYRIQQYFHKAVNTPVMPANPFRQAQPGRDRRTNRFPVELPAFNFRSPHRFFYQNAGLGLNLQLNIQGSSHA